MVYDVDEREMNDDDDDDKGDGDGGGEGSRRERERGREREEGKESDEMVSGWTLSCRWVSPTSPYATHPMCSRLSPNYIPAHPPSLPRTPLSSPSITLRGLILHLTPCLP